MKLAVLLKFDEKDKYLIDYLSKQLSPLEPELHFIHVDPVAGDVPLKIDGSVLENCTEFDLSVHYETVKHRQKELEEQLVNFAGSKISVIAGNPLNFISYYIKFHDIDCILSGSHVTNWQEVLQASFATQVAHQLNIPMLSLKCDRSEDEIKRIGIVVDEAEMDLSKMSGLLKLARAHNAELVLMRTPDHQSDNLHAVLFPVDIKVSEVTVGGSINDHDFYKCTQEHQIDLLVTFRQHPTFWKRIFSKESTDYLLDHLQLPLFII